MDYKKEYDRWLQFAADEDIQEELCFMDDIAIEDAFYRDLAFGTGGLRGIIGAGTNRMNIYVVAKASQGLSQYILDHFSTLSVVIGYDNRIKSDLFAKVAAGVFAANGLTVHLWPYLSPVPTVSFAVRELKCSQGIMITASHNSSRYNGYKVYGADGCQITTEAAKDILDCINALDIFSDIKSMDFDEAAERGLIKYIPESVMDAFADAVKSQSVLFGDEVKRDVAIVYSPLNGTGLLPVTRVLEESGFTNITVVEEQRNPDGNFPTCPYPNPEVKEAMELGLQHAADIGAELLLATDPDCDRCGIAVKNGSGYQLLSGNEVGLLLLDFICSQRTKHQTMPAHPVFIKTIVTIELAEKIAANYGVKTINVLTGFKFIGEQIGLLEDEADYICGFEESYGYLIGSYVRDKDGVNAAFMICEMFAFYKSRGVSLLEKLEELYRTYGYCLNTLHSYEFPGFAGMERMGGIMWSFRTGLSAIAGMEVIKTEDYSKGLNGLPPSDVLKFYFKGAEDTSGAGNETEEQDAGRLSRFVVIRPSGTEPKLKLYISVMAEDVGRAQAVERQISTFFLSLFTDSMPPTYDSMA